MLKESKSKQVGTKGMYLWYLVILWWEMKWWKGECCAQFSCCFLSRSTYHFSPTAKLCYGVLSHPVQLQHQVPGKVPEGSGADTSWGSGGFRWRYLLRLRKFCAVPEGSGADTLWASGGFRRRYLMRFRKFPAQILYEVPEVSGAGARWGSGFPVQILA